MTAVTQSTALLALALLGALAQFAVALRLYEPPPREAGEEPPTPVLEATLFGVVFGIVYLALGYGLSALEDFAPPFGTLGVLLVAGVGLYSAYATSSGRVGAPAAGATQAMGVTTGITIAVIAIAVLVL